MATQQQDEIVRFLKRTRLFQDVPSVQLEGIAPQCVCIRKKQGDVLFRKGDAAKYFYFIKSGVITESVSYRESVDVIIKLKIPGDYFGETAVMAGIPYLSTSLAVSDAQLIAIPKNVFLILAANNFCVCQTVIRELTERLTNSAQKMVNNMFLDAEGRLASVIVSLIASLGQKLPCQIPITQGSLAASCGMARQTAAEIIGRWKKAGWIDTGRGKINVRDITPLLQIIADSELRC